MPTALLGCVPPGGVPGAVYVPTYTKRACASDGLVLADSSEAAASARGPSAANAVVAPSIGRNSRLVKPADDFESCLRFSDEAMEPPCKTITPRSKKLKALRF